MVRNTPLRVVVSADFGRTVSGGNHGLTLGRNTVEIFLMLKIIKSGTQFLEGTVLILEL